MKLRMPKLIRVKRPARIMIAVLCAFALSAACAEVKQDITEANGKVTQIEWKNDEGKLVPGPEGYAKIRYSYKGDDITEMYFDENGVTCKSAEGAYGKKTTTDGKGRTIAVEYLDPNGKRMLNNQGYGLMTVSYHSFGAERVVAYYGSGKRLVVVPVLGYAKVVNEYSYKTMTSREYQDTKGKPVDCAEGYASVKQKLDKKARVLSIRYDHADGKPATGPDGWFRCKFERDEDGRITQERFLDENGKATVNTLGVGGIRYIYDHDGRIETVTYLDTEGNPAACNKGYAGYTDTFDEDGATTTRTYLGTDDLATEIAGGYSEVRYFYDETKALTDTRYYDANGTQVGSGQAEQAEESAEPQEQEEPEEAAEETYPEEEPAEEPEE